MTYRIKIISKKTGCYIKLPEDFCEQLDLKKSKELEGKITPRGSLELIRPLTAADMCQVCRQKKHRNNICINCGKVTCGACFWELGSLCHECLGKGEAKRK